MKKLTNKQKKELKLTKNKKYCIKCLGLQEIWTDGIYGYDKAGHILYVYNYKSHKLNRRTKNG